MPVPGAPGRPQEGLTGSGCGGIGVVEAAAGDAVGLNSADEHECSESRLLATTPCWQFKLT